MIPAIGPRKPEYPTSHPVMYDLGSLSSFQGIMAMPTTPVMMPPMRNEMRRGFRLEKSFDGETTFAATFVFNVAMRRAINAMNATTGWLNRPSNTTGSQIGSPKMIQIGRASCRERE